MNDNVIWTLKRLAGGGHEKVSISLIQRKMKYSFLVAKAVLDDLVRTGGVLKIDEGYILAPEFRLTPDSEYDEIYRNGFQDGETSQREKLGPKIDTLLEFARVKQEGLCLSPELSDEVNKLIRDI